MRSPSRYSIREFLDSKGVSPYREGLEGLSLQFKARIQVRILRFEQGNLGDIKNVGKGVWEVRLDFGPGFRVYFGFDGKEVIILLTVGDKSTQSKDIKKAQIFWLEFLEDKENG